MTLHRCYAHPSQWSEQGVALSGEELHHARRVLRLAAGALCLAFDGEGREAVIRLAPEPEAPRARRAAPESMLCPIERLTHVAAPEPAIVLIQALPRAARMDWLVEKATELGVTAIHPVLAARSVVSPGRGGDGAHVERWRRIGISAAKQCGFTRLPRIEAPEALERLEPLIRGLDLLVLGSLDPAATALADLLQPLRGSVLRSVGLMIGPEGDWTDGETDWAVRHGARPAHYATPTLRVETAALFGLSVLVHTFRRCG